MSKKKRDWKLFIMEILESINKIEKYIEGLNYEQFVRDEKTKDAVVRNLEIIGEAANQLPKEIQQKFSNVPWAQIIAMRNRMIHDIPSLKKELELILQKGGEE
jgi:uncharacterized protein with HEPN domain